MKKLSLLILVFLQFTVSVHVFGQNKVVNLSDSASFYYEKKDFKKAFDFYEAYFSSPNSFMNNFSTYYAAVASCHAGNLERAKYYLKKSAEIGYDFSSYDKILNDDSNICLRGLAEWKEYISKYKTVTDQKLADLKRRNEELNDTTKRVNRSTLTNSKYWQEYSSKHSAAQLVEHIKTFNNYPSSTSRNFWTQYNIKVNDTLTVPFLLHIPQNYHASKKTPLYVYLHGGIINRPRFIPPAEVATSLEIKVMDNSHAQDAFIIYAFGKKDFGWLYQQVAFETIIREIAMVKSYYNIDDNKVYIGGHSNGGSGAFWYAINKPSPFAAIFGLNYLPKVYSSNTPFFNLNNDVPFLGVSGTEDGVFPLKVVNGIYDLAVTNGANWKNYNIQGGHDATIMKRDSIGYLFDNLSAQVRNPYPKKIQWETDNVKNGRNLWIEISELDTLAQKADWHLELNPTLTQNGKTAVVNFNKNKSGAVTATIDNNIIDIKTSRVKKLKLYISPDMIDLTRKIKIRINDKEFMDLKISADKRTILDEFERTKDRAFIVSNIIQLSIN